MSTPFLEGGGEMGALIRSRDWTKTPLGAPEAWPQSLKTAVRILLTSRYAMWMGWGPELSFFYNDAYRPTLGIKHPWALGPSAREVWKEIWPDIGPRIDRVLQTGEATWDEGLLLFLERSGFPEETYHTFSYSPLPDDSGAVGGMLCVVTEETQRILGERRLALLRDVAARLSATRATPDVFAGTAACLAMDARDIPFSLVYRFDADGRAARRVATTGLGEHHGAAAEVYALEKEGSPWPFTQVREGGQPVLVERLPEGEHWPRGPWDRAPTRAFLLPLAGQGQATPVGVFIAGLNPYRPLDEGYVDFLRLFVGQVAAGLANAQAYEEEKRRAEVLAELDRAKTAFFSNVSHEFRTPLTLMLGPLDDILAKSEEGLLPENRAMLKVVHRNGQRLLKLVNTLLDFARIEAGRAQASYEPTELAGLTAELASNFRSACERAGLRLIVDCPPLPEPAYVDREMWEKIVLNLLSNAFKFTLEGEIEVRVRDGGDRFEVAVRDTGTGIPADSLPRMFQRFHRVEGARGRSYEGSGIGLALVQELVRMHGGSIEVQSTPDVGTTFTVSIPKGSAHLPGESVESTRRAAGLATRADAYVDEALSWLSGMDSAPAPVRPPNALRILLADDNTDLREYARRLLAEHYEVEAVADGEAALAAARARRPDLIVSDVMMPRLDGFGLIRELRADPGLRAVPVVLLSARAGEEARIEGLGQGADDYLVKPFSSRELLVRVGTLVQTAASHRRANEALAQFEILLNRAPLGVYLVDDEFRIAAVNPIALPVFGDIPDLIGRPFDAVLRVLWPKAFADELIGHFRHTLETGEAHIVPERVEQRLDSGVTEFYEWQIHRIPLPGNRQGVVCYFRDISRSVMTREALRDADRRKDAFLATLSHELRNPLAPLQNSLQLLRLTGIRDPAARPIHEMMERQVTHLVRLVDDLLEVSRINRGTFELRKERIELAAVVRNAIETSTPLIQAGRHELRVSLPEASLWLDGDPVRLAQILANLLNNAATYTESGGRISVEARREGDTAFISVRDTGDGIAREALPRMFEMFSRGDRPRARGQGGLGIGLSLARRLAEMHGGTITAASEGPGKGSEFTVRLPLLPDQAPHPAVPRPLEPSMPHKRILIVDDNRDAADSLGAILTILGADVRVAYDGLGALEVFGAYDPAVVLLDIGMPGMDGHEVARRIRTGFPERGTAIVALTGWGQQQDLRSTREAGFDHHLVKPAGIDALQTLLKSLDQPSREEGGGSR